MSNDGHQKHGTVVKPALGQYGRNEWAILGAPCGVIQGLAGELCARLGAQWQLAYLDADHAGNNGAQEVPTLAKASAGESSGQWAMTFTDKIGWHRMDLAAQPSPFEYRYFFHEMDAVLINGNHFVGARQIVIVDPAKKDSLQRKLDRLGDVALVLLQDGQSRPWPFLQERLAGNPAPVLHLADIDAVSEWMEAQLRAAVPPLRGVVLAGGYSKRMGHDKGLIEYHGKPQREYMADLLGPLCVEAFISCRPDQAASIRPPYRALPDSFYDLGPFGAILSAFRAFPDSAWMVAACDLPLLDSPTLHFLAEHRDPSRMATAFQSPVNEFPEPLIAIWEPKAYPTLLQYLAQGSSCPRKALINSRVALLDAPDAKALTNVNTPEEWETYGLRPEAYRT